MAIIQDGTTKNEKFGFGTIENICDVVAEKTLTSPAIIVIGEVVKERVKLDEVYNEIMETIVT